MLKSPLLVKMPVPRIVSVALSPAIHPMLWKRPAVYIAAPLSMIVVPLRSNTLASPFHTTLLRISVPPPFRWMTPPPDALTTLKIVAVEPVPTSSPFVPPPVASTTTRSET